MLKPRGQVSEHFWGVLASVDDCVSVPIVGCRRSRAKHSLCVDPLPGMDWEDSLLCATYYTFAQPESRSTGNLSEELLLRKHQVQPLSSELKHYLFVHLSPGTVGFLSDRCMPHASHFPTPLLHLPPCTLHTLWPLSKCSKRKCFWQFAYSSQQFYCRV